MSAGRDNAADVECSSENYKVEGEDTVKCLRGRLLAERMASRNATQEADHLEIRLMEVGMLLEKEEKSRKRAEKKLKLLRKKLQCINISSMESQQSDQLNSSEDSRMESLSSSCGGDSVATSMSMALVPVEVSSPEKERVDPEVLDATVRQVLESLRHAKEQLRSSMERRRMSISMIKVG